MTEPPEYGLAVQLVSRPEGPLEHEHLAVVEKPMPRLAPGWVLVRNLFAALDPHPSTSPVRHWPLYTALPAGSLVGEVVASRSADLPHGSLIAHRGGWSTYSALPRGGYATRVLEPAAGVPIEAYLTVLGLPGLAAHVALTRVLNVKRGESLFIAGAAGPVGSATARIARTLGASRVVGGVTSPAGARRAIQDPYFDAVFERRADSVAESVLFGENTGMDVAVIGTAGAAGSAGSAGSSLTEALTWVRDAGRVAWLHDTPWGSTESVVSVDLAMVQRRGIRLEGFGLQHHLHRFKEIEAQYADDLQSGRLDPGTSMDVDVHGLIDVLVAATRSDHQSADTYRIVESDS
jgi:NADPH-dependent curcumin reductase CurA